MGILIVHDLKQRVGPLVTVGPGNDEHRVDVRLHGCQGTVEKFLHLKPEVGIPHRLHALERSLHGGSHIGSVAQNITLLAFHKLFPDRLEPRLCLFDYRVDIAQHGSKSGHVIPICGPVHVPARFRCLQGHQKQGQHRTCIALCLRPHKLAAAVNGHLLFRRLGAGVV